MEGTLIVVGGPTAVGKTALSIRLAEWLGTEIISADSRQCYREMTIGTAKPSEEELARVPHHFINSHSIHEVFTAGDFSRAARDLLDNLFEKYKVVITTGGSGLYLKAFLSGIADIPDIDPSIRTRLNERYAGEGLDPLRKELEARDPEFSREADMNNPQRVIRALEVCYGTGKKFSDFRDSRASEPLDCKILSLGLNTDRDILYERINRRVDAMVLAGLFEEAEALIAFRDHYALQTVGYKEVFEYIDGHYSREEAIERIRLNTRRYAKRQLTWFRKYGDMEWFHPEDWDEIRGYVTQVTGLS